MRFLRHWCLLNLLPLLAPTALLTSCVDHSSVNDVLYFDVLDHKFTAVREFQCYDPRAPMRYIEELVCQGDGKTSQLNLLELNGKARADITNPAELAAFDRLQASMDAGGGERILHQRDFRVEDLSLADRNYRVFPDGLQMRAIGGGAGVSEASVAYWVIPHVQDRPFHRVTLSLEDGRVGFPLAYEEYVNTASGAVLVSETSVLSLDFGNAAAPRPGHTPVIKSRQRVTLNDVVAQATGPVFFPAALPVGYQLDYIEDIVMSTDATPDGKVRDVRLTRILFTDGVDLLQIIQHSPTYGGPLAGLPVQNRAQRGGAVRQDDHLLMPVYRFSSISIASAITSSYQITIESKLSTERFNQVLESLRQLN